MITFSMILLSAFSTHAFNLEQLPYQGLKSEQTIDSKVLATGDYCQVYVEDQELVIEHNAKIEGWSVFDPRVSVDLTQATKKGNTYEQKIGKLSMGYCGDWQSANSVERTIEITKEKAIYTESYRCSLSVKKTVKQHVCYFN